MDGFALHPQLAKDTVLIGHLAGSQLLLMDDARFPWLILVPLRWMSFLQPLKMRCYVHPVQ